jgi:radical SAM superfamily enzyme YgiQ (UPF0313 family)
MKLLLLSLQSNAYVTGLKYIAANSRAHGHDVRILFIPGYLESEIHPSIKAFIHEYNPDLIGISLMSIEYYPSKNITRLIKKSFSIPVVWGGVHAIIKPEECIQHADYVCTGEGEHVIVSLLDHLSACSADEMPEVKGLWVNHKGAVIKQENALPEMDLDILPYQEYLPDYFYGYHLNGIHNLAEDERIFRRYALYGGTCHMIISTRGCPFKCSYCGNSAMSTVYGRKIRERSVDNVIEELVEVKKNPFVLYMNFQDDCFFTHRREWIKKFCGEYKKHVNLPFIVRVIPTMMDKEKMLMLKDAGLCWIIMGIQSGSDWVNYEVYDRNIPFVSVKKAAGIISETKAAPFYEMIVDNPYETDEDRIVTISAMSSLPKPYIASLAHLTFFPGTPLADRAINDKIAAPDAYLFRYLLKVDDTYLNKLLSITPNLPGSIVKYLNVPVQRRKTAHRLFLNVLYPLIKRLVEPAVFFFLTARSLDYDVNSISRTIMGNWRTTVSRLISRYLGKTDMEFDQRLALARRTMPDLFDK